MKLLSGVLVLAACATAQMRTVTMPGKSPLVTFRIVFTTGAAADPADKPGLANLTAMVIADGGTKELTYKQVADALFPMAAGVNAQVDKEMTMFGGATHVDNLGEYYKLLRGRLLTPGWREDDFRRVKDDAINAIKVSLRGNNDEELGKEVLYENIYQGTPYGHLTAGTVSSLEKITLDDVKAFYKSQYAQSQLIIGIAGGYTPEFLAAMKKDFAALPATAGTRPRISAPGAVEKSRMVIVDKDTRSVAFSLGYPIEVTRGKPDYAALLLVSSYLGQHRMSSGVLYDRMREKRGLNYGDYAYVEYFPRGMFLMEPQPNLARHQQIFQVWIRPVEPPTAKFALRLAMFELDKLQKNGMTQAQFESARGFLGKYINVLTRTKRAELGYAIDSMFYGTPPYNEYLKTQLARLTLAEVNRVIKQYIRTDRMVIAAVTKNGEALRQELASDGASPMTYNSPKPQEITEEDKLVIKWPLGLKVEDIKGTAGSGGISVMEIKLVPLEIPEGGNLILGQSHFIKTVEDIYEAIVNTVPQMKFGVAFNEASGPCLTRVEGNDDALKALAAKNASAVAAGHTFVVVMTDGYPINILGRIKDVPEVCGIFCATANAVQVVVAESEQGRGVLGVIDGASPLGVEGVEDAEKRRGFLRMIGYKR